MDLVQVGGIHHPLLALTTVGAILQGGSYSVVLATGMSWSSAPHCVYACIQITCVWSLDIAPAVGESEQTDHLQLEDVTILTLLAIRAVHLDHIRFSSEIGNWRV